MARRAEREERAQGTVSGEGRIAGEKDRGIEAAGAGPDQRSLLLSLKLYWCNGSACVAGKWLRRNRDEVDQNPGGLASKAKSYNRDVQSCGAGGL